MTVLMLFQDPQGSSRGGGHFGGVPFLKNFHGPTPQKPPEGWGHLGLRVVILPLMVVPHFPSSNFHCCLEEECFCHLGVQFGVIVFFFLVKWETRLIRVQAKGCQACCRYIEYPDLQMYPDQALQHGIPSTPFTVVPEPAFRDCQCSGPCVQHWRPQVPRPLHQRLGPHIPRQYYGVGPASSLAIQVGIGSLTLTECSKSLDGRLERSKKRCDCPIQLRHVQQDWRQRYPLGIF